MNIIFSLSMVDGIIGGLVLCMNSCMYARMYVFFYVCWYAACMRVRLADDFINVNTETK